MILSLNNSLTDRFSVLIQIIIAFFLLDYGPQTTQLCLVSVLLSKHKQKQGDKRRRALNRNVRKHPRMVNIFSLFGDICFCVLWSGRASSLLFSPQAIMIPFFRASNTIDARRRQAFLNINIKVLNKI